jgi:hypothetical protein
MSHRFIFIPFFLCPHGFTGSFDIISHGFSGSSGHLPLGAIASGVVNLRIEDSPGFGGNLVSSDGIQFGEVNNLGTTQTSGITGWATGKVGHYEAKFAFTAERSGEGTLTLHCERSSPGNFNSRDGVEITDHQGVLRPLSALFNKSVVVLSHVTSGSYEKTIAINIHPHDKGHLRTALKFTLCAL